MDPLFTPPQSTFNTPVFGSKSTLDLHIPSDDVCLGSNISSYDRENLLVETEQLLNEISEMFGSFGSCNSTSSSVTSTPYNSLHPQDQTSLPRSFVHHSRSSSTISPISPPNSSSRSLVEAWPLTESNLTTPEKSTSPYSTTFLNNSTDSRLALGTPATTASFVAMGLNQDHTDISSLFVHSDEPVSSASLQRPKFSTSKTSPPALITPKLATKPDSSSNTFGKDDFLLGITTSGIPFAAKKKNSNDKNKVKSKRTFSNSSSGKCTVDPLVKNVLPVSKKSKAQKEDEDLHHNDEEGGIEDDIADEMLPQRIKQIEECFSKIIFVEDGEDKKYQCPTCSRAMRRRCDIKRHITSVHFKLKPYKCFLCQKSYTRSDVFKTHFVKCKQYAIASAARNNNVTPSNNQNVASSGAAIQ